jgi:hypothetical protein
MLKLFITAQMSNCLCFTIRKQINPTVFNLVLQGDY